MVDIYLTDEFKRQFKRLTKKYHSLPTDFKTFIRDMEMNPNQGIDLGKNIRKVRMAISSKGKGKSGGARVIAYHLTVADNHLEITLLAIYDKSELANISDAYLKSLLENML